MTARKNTTEDAAAQRKAAAADALLATAGKGASAGDKPRRSRASRSAAKAAEDGAKARAANAEPKAEPQPKPEPVPCSFVGDDGRRCNRREHGDELAHRFPRVLSAETATARSTLLAGLEAKAVGDLALPEGYVLH